MGPYNALYYPYIHFKSDAWLKVAALYWDSLGRVVPRQYVTDDSDTVKALGDFVITYRPESVSPVFADAFAGFIREYGARLRTHYDVSMRDSWPVLGEKDRPSSAGGPSGSDPRLSYIFIEKLSDETITAFLESRLAMLDQRDSPWVGMHPRLAWVYMTALADQLASEQGARPLTDETRDHLAASGLSHERLAQALLGDVCVVDSKATSGETEALLISIAFQSVLPANPGSLDVDAILEFRQTYPTERAAFQQAAEKLLQARQWLFDIPRREVLEQRLREELEKDWLAQLAELRAKLADVRIDTVLGCFNLQVALPAAMAAAVSASGLVAHPIASGAAGLALGAIPYFRDKRKVLRDAASGSPVSYLYRMEQELKPKDLWGRVSQRAAQFAFGA